MPCMRRPWPPRSIAGLTVYVPGRRCVGVQPHLLYTQSGLARSNYNTSEETRKAVTRAAVSEWGRVAIEALCKTDSPGTSGHRSALQHGTDGAVNFKYGRRSDMSTRVPIVKTSPNCKAWEQLTENPRTRVRVWGAGAAIATCRAVPYMFRTNQNAISCRSEGTRLEQPMALAHCSPQHSMKVQVAQLLPGLPLTSMATVS